MDKHVPLKCSFRCDESQDAEWQIASLFGDTGFNVINHRPDLLLLLEQSPRVLVLGVFDWSNYSWETFRKLSDEKKWLEAWSISVGVMCLGCVEQTEAISPEMAEFVSTAITEPMLFYFEDGHLRHTFFGRESFSELQKLF